MKIFFDQVQFPKVLEECSVNDDKTVLNHDIEYIPSDSNKVVLEDNEADREDWQALCDNWPCFIGYIIDTIQESMSEEDSQFCEGMSCMDVFEREFIVIE